jgi:predicted dithiol-disulfide oxidoreductase (DUF899 family)
MVAISIGRSRRRANGTPDRVSREEWIEARKALLAKEKE